MKKKINKKIQNLEKILKKSWKKQKIKKMNIYGTTLKKLCENLPSIIFSVNEEKIKKKNEKSWKKSWKNLEKKEEDRMKERMKGGEDERMK